MKSEIENKVKYKKQFIVKEVIVYYSVYKTYKGAAEIVNPDCIGYFCAVSGTVCTIQNTRRISV